MSIKGNEMEVMVNDYVNECTSLIDKIIAENFGGWTKALLDLDLDGDDKYAAECFKVTRQGIKVTHRMANQIDFLTNQNKTLEEDVKKLEKRINDLSERLGKEEKFTSTMLKA